MGLTLQYTEWRSLAGQDLQKGIYGHDLFVDTLYRHNPAGVGAGRQPYRVEHGTDDNQFDVVA